MGEPAFPGQVLFSVLRRTKRELLTSMSDFPATPATPALQRLRTYICSRFVAHVVLGNHHDKTTGPGVLESRDGD